ncbi:hypothetical protein [Variovorax sp. GT1P44]|uniref:baeRF11 domain-containing protein n=1 Tax=Variovorax sp. GT1P44 TaxID=3443742 RepID=UPI003F48ADCE
MLHLDIPTREQIDVLFRTRVDACVSIYLPTTQLSQHTDASRIQLGNLLKSAMQQLDDAGIERKRRLPIEENIEELIADYEFWRFQANSLAILATTDHIWTFRLATSLQSQVEVSGRFHLSPLVRAVTFPHAALVLALSENQVRLIEFFAEGAPVEVQVAEMPTDAASSAGLDTINDRSPSGRITGSEGKKVRLVQFARKVDAALRPVLSGIKLPLFLASAEPLASIFRTVCNSVELAAEGVAGNAERSTALELAAAARPLLDHLYARQLEELRSQFSSRLQIGRATSDLADAGRAAALGAIDTLLIDIDATVRGTYDETTGAITLSDASSKDTYGVFDAIAMCALASGARVLGVRAQDLPEGQHLAAILRFSL